MDNTMMGQAPAAQSTEPKGIERMLASKQGNGGNQGGQGFLGMLPFMGGMKQRAGNQMQGPPNLPKMQAEAGSDFSNGMRNAYSR